jgi:hypothetical protein
MMSVCELYLDDLIIAAESEEELLENLAKVLERFRQYGLTINPDKCVFGKSSVTYVGHTIDKDGMHFERDKLDSVLNFPKPSRQKELKSFVSLASYFRDHVDNLSTRIHPLNAMLEGYNRTKRLKWTKEGEEAFLDIKKAIDECPRLWFMDDTSPIFLATDASNYGIGAYLYQIRDGKEVPIMFLSKTLEARMRKWHTAHKEGYAIFYALRKLEYLLRDRTFTLKTDHANLRFLKANYSNEDKVQRWLACYQGFDMQIDYLEGPKNEIADALSRLCSKDEQEQELLLAFEVEQDVYVVKDKWNIIKTVHGATSGHHGTERTVQKLKSAGHYWDGMRADVIKFRRCCPCCQKMAILKGPIHARKFTVSSNAPMENLAIDFIEKLLVDEYGNKYILVVIDSFSRFIELYPTKTNTAVEVAKHLLEHCGRYGKPASIKTDKGAAFANKVINELCIMLGIVHEKTMAYSKEENAIVERANKEIMRHLRNIIFDKDVLKKWSDYLPLVQRIMNSCEHSVTGVSPAEIVFGNAINLDNGIILDRHPNTDKSQRLSKWMADMLAVQQKIIHIAQQNLDKHHTVHMNTQPNELSEFPVNSYVLVEYKNPFRKGPKSKLLPYRKGPMRVINFIGSKYVLQDLVTKRNKNYHVKRLSPFAFDPDQHNPFDYALRDQTEWFHVEKIIHMRGNPDGPKGSLSFKVKWVNEDKMTWEPWKTVRNTKALKDYLSTHRKENVRNLLPQNVVDEDESSDSEQSNCDSDMSEEEL